jgi:hypothetical protein
VNRVRERPREQNPETPGSLGPDMLPAMWPDHTAFERVHLAVCDMAQSAKPLQQRLETAGLTLLPLLDRDFREGDERELFSRVKSGLTGTGPLDDELGTLHTTTGLMDDATAERVAREIVELYGLLFD